MILGTTILIRNCNVICKHRCFRCWKLISLIPFPRVTRYTAGHLHTAVPHCSHSRAPIVHTAVPRENNEHGCVYLRCTPVCKLPSCVEGHPWFRPTRNFYKVVPCNSRDPAARCWPRVRSGKSFCSLKRSALVYNVQSLCTISYRDGQRWLSLKMGDIIHLLWRKRMTSSNGNIFRVTGLCEGNPPVTGGFPSQRPVTRSFYVFFDLHLSKQSRRRWF